MVHTFNEVTKYNIEDSPKFVKSSSTLGVTTDSPESLNANVIVGDSIPLVLLRRARAILIIDLASEQQRRVKIPQGLDLLFAGGIETR